jgi:DNA-binding Lrp family transcriptional regulator
VTSHGGPFRADGLDLQILHALQVNGRAGLGMLGRVLKVSDQTVIRRYAKLRSAGGLRVVGTADEIASGQRRWYVRVRTTPDAATAISQAIARHPDTAWVRLVSGGTEIVCSVRAGDAAGGRALLLDKLPRISRVLDVRAQSELHVHARNAHRMLQIVGALDAEQLWMLREQDPPVPAPDAATGAGPAGFRVGESDLALLNVLHDDARAPVEKLAAATGMSPSATRRHLARLQTSGALRIDVDVDPAALGLHEHALLWINVAPAHLETTGAALATHPQVTFAAVTTGTTNLYVSVMTPDTPTLYQYLTQQIAALPAIANLESTLVIESLKASG